MLQGEADESEEDVDVHDVSQLVSGYAGGLHVRVGVHDGDANGQGSPRSRRQESPPLRDARSV